MGRVEEPNPFTVVSGTTHNANFVTIDSSDASECTSSSVDIIEVRDVENLFYVSVRDSDYTAVSASTVYEQCSSFDDCTTVNILNDDGYLNSCSMHLDDCRYGPMCAQPGSYQVSFSPSPIGGGFKFEYQIITQYVNLDSFVSTTIYGDTAHFYQISNTNQAITVDVTVNYGAALEITLISDCSSGYFENQLCFQETCSMYIARESEQPGNGVLYLSLESAHEYLSSPIINQAFYEKETSYSVSVTRGLGNCMQAPSSGFCGDIFSELSSQNVWHYDDSDRLDAQAECIYRDYVESYPCGSATLECTQLLKRYACLQVYPQCSSNGYQMNLCHDLCTAAEAECGPFYNVIDSEIATLTCDRAFYTPGSNGTCVNNLQLDSSAQETPFNPLQFFNDNAPNRDIALDSITVPVFDTITATLPPIILNGDDDN